MGKPCLLKKPVSAFILFMSDLKNDADFKKQLGNHQKDYIKEGSVKWNTIDSETKQFYKDRAQVLKEQYQQQLLALKSQVRSKNATTGDDEEDAAGEVEDEEEALNNRSIHQAKVNLTYREVHAAAHEPHQANTAEG